MDTSVTIFSLGYIIILIVPGIIFKRFYFQGAFSGQFNSGLFADRIITSLFWGILVQMICAISFSSIINMTYGDWQTIVQKFYQELATNNLPSITYNQLLYILFYAICSVVIAALMGHFFYKFVRGTGLDIRLRAFRFTNSWHYYFKGEILQSSEYKMGHRGEVISTEVDLIVKNDDGKSNLFSGLLTDYRLDSNNELDTLYLTGTTRYSQSLKSNKLIPGDIFIIPMTTVQNLNIRYNFQVRKDRQLFKHIVLAFSAIMLVFSIAYPWFIEIGIWRKILGCFTLFISWISFSSLIMSFFPPSNGAIPLSNGAKTANLIVLIVMILVSNQILKVVPFLYFGS